MANQEVEKAYEQGFADGLQAGVGTYQIELQDLDAEDVVDAFEAKE